MSSANSAPPLPTKATVRSMNIKCLVPFIHRQVREEISRRVTALVAALNDQPSR
jgi:hypothetical protein